jgi:hypothetical protein
VDPREELPQQLLELEVAEGSVGHDLKLLEPNPGLSLRREQASVCNRDRGPVCDELEELDVFGREGPRAERADVEDAEELPSDDERDAEQALDALLAQYRIEDLRAVDVLDDDRTTLSSHAPGEPTVDRDPDAPLDFLLEADGSPGDELVPFVVMEEDRGCVRLEGFADSRQQFAEQLVELEVRERGIGN